MTTLLAIAGGTAITLTTLAAFLWNDTLHYRRINHPWMPPTTQGDDQ